MLVVALLISVKLTPKISCFPSSIIASIFGFTKEKGIATPREGEHMAVSQKEIDSPKVDLS